MIAELELGTEQNIVIGFFAYEMAINKNKLQQLLMCWGIEEEKPRKFFTSFLSPEHGSSLRSTELAPQMSLTLVITAAALTKA